MPHCEIYLPILGFQLGSLHENKLNFFCCFDKLLSPKDHVEEEGIIFLALVKSHDRLQRSPFTNLIGPSPPQISSVVALCACTALPMTRCTLSFEFYNYSDDHF